MVDEGECRKEKRGLYVVLGSGIYTMGIGIIVVIVITSAGLLSHRC